MWGLDFGVQTSFDHKPGQENVQVLFSEYQKKCLSIVLERNKNLLIIQYFFHLDFIRPP